MKTKLAPVCAALAALGLAACDSNSTISFTTPFAGERVKPTYFLGEDGSKAPLAWRDTELGYDCDFQRIGEAFVCIKQGGWIPAFHYSDAACTKPVGEGDSAALYLVNANRTGVFQRTETKAAGGCFQLVGGKCQSQPGCATESGPLYLAVDVTDTLAKGAEFIGQ